MTLSQIKLALLLPLAFGCAHAVYDGQPESSDSNTDEPTVNVAGSASVVTMLPNKETPNLGAAGSATDFGSGGAPAAGGEPGVAGAAANAASSNAAAGTTENGGAPTGGATNSAKASTGGAATAGSPGAGTASGGTTSSAGSTGAGAPTAGAPSAGCTDIPIWSEKTYFEGDKVQSGNKIYKCRPWPNVGWCGAGPAYAPATGAAWTDAWTSVGPC